MWLINSSIGRKVVMSVTGIALILFLTFHGCMNIVALFSGEAYNWICEALGANWYAVVATLGLAALAVIHIVYAFILTAQNRSARGSERYAETEKPAKVEWASQNMLVLGIVVVLGLLLHLFNFWYNMMFAELIGTTMGHLPSDGFAFIIDTFQNPVYVVLYIVWLVALWFHLTHGFWSHADYRYQRQTLVQPLARYRQHLCDSAHPCFHSSSSSFRCWTCSQPVVV